VSPLKLFSILLLFFVSQFSRPASSAEIKIKLASTNIEGLIDQTATGKYNLLFDYIAQHSPLKIEATVLPGRRIEKSFLSQKFDCFFPGNAVENPGNFLSSAHFNSAKAFIAHISDKAPYIIKEELEGRYVGKVDGLNYNGWENIQGVKYLSVGSEVEMLRLLETGRVSAALVYFPDTALVRPDLAKTLIFDRDRPIVELKEQLVCHNNNLLQAFISEFNTKIVELRSTGVLQKILGDSYFE